jgi:hypothetical protein
VSINEWPMILTINKVKKWRLVCREYDMVRSFVMR